MDFFNEFFSSCKTRQGIYYILELRFFISGKIIKMSSFTVCVFRETVTTFVVCYVRVAPLT